VLKSAGSGMTVLLGALVAIAPLSMDIYLPSLPSMTRALGTTADQVQLTISVYMFGWGVAQLFAGPIADRFGRRPAFLWALVVYVLASVACALAQDIGTLVAARFAQALGMAAVAVVPRAVVRDLHAGERAARMLSTMMLVLGVAPVVAPILGAELHVRFGWRANFAFVTLYGALLWLAVRFGLPETLRAPDTTALDPRVMLRQLAARARVAALRRLRADDRRRVSGLFAFLAGSAFVFVDAMGESERWYSVYLGLVSLGVFAGTALVAPRAAAHRPRTPDRGEHRRNARRGCDDGGARVARRPRPLAVAAPMFVFMAAYMGTVPQATAGRSRPTRTSRAAPRRLMSFVQFVIAASVALVVGFAFDGTARPMRGRSPPASVLSFVAFRCWCDAPRRLHPADDRRQLLQVDRARAFLDLRRRRSRSSSGPARAAAGTRP